MFPIGPIFYLFLFIRVISVISRYAILQHATKTVLNRYIGSVHKRTKVDQKMFAPIKGWKLNFLRIAEINFLTKVIFKHKMYYTTSKHVVFGRKVLEKPKSPRETIFPTLSAREFGSGAHNSRGHRIPCNTGNLLYTHVLTCRFALVSNIPIIPKSAIVSNLVNMVHNRINLEFHKFALVLNFVDSQ